MKRAVMAMLLAFATAAPALAADVRLSYSYFPIRGSTLDDIERELSRHGPNVSSTGQRHPGATRMEFKTNLVWQNRKNRCSLKSAKVTLIVKVILPKWRPDRRAGKDTRFVWSTLAADIKRHEDAHVIIAKNHARTLEKALMSMGSYSSCDKVKKRAETVTERILDAHEREQQRFDRVESAGFEKRLDRLLERRLKMTDPS